MGMPLGGSNETPVQGSGVGMVDVSHVATCVVGGCGIGQLYTGNMESVAERVEAPAGPLMSCEPPYALCSSRNGLATGIAESKAPDGASF